MSIQPTADRRIAHAVAEATSRLFGAKIADSDIQIQDTRKEFDGEFTVVAFPLARHAKRSPEDTAIALGDYLVEHLDEVEGYSVIKGFLNLRMTPEFWCDRLVGMMEAGYGRQAAASRELVLVEYASPNTNKPLHLGHLRNIFLGDSVSRILTAAGHVVKRVQIINDRGIHICKSMVAWKKFGAGETPQSSGMKGDHLVGKYYVAFDKAYKAEVAQLTAEGMDPATAEAEAPIMVEARKTLLLWEQSDAETYALWQRMNGWVYEGFEVSYRRMGVSFDKLYYESDTWTEGKKAALEGVASGVFERREDGSVWADLSDEGLDQKLLLRKDGTAVYMTQDLGTAILRYRDFPEVKRMIYTVGNEQEYHFKVLFLLLKKLGYGWAENCFHLSYGMVELPEGKMKSREGTVVDADDIMEQMVNAAAEITAELGKLDGVDPTEKARLHEMIGIAALKYFLLKVDPVKNMLFDPKESIDFNGHTGPFIQYTHARTRSVLRNFGATPDLGDYPDTLGEYERHVLIRLHRYPEVVAESAREYNPARLANYLYDLVKDFNAFYQNVSILKAENEAARQFRAGIALAVATVIEDGMGLLGIAVPERM